MSYAGEYRNMLIPPLLVCSRYILRPKRPLGLSKVNAQVGQYECIVAVIGDEVLRVVGEKKSALWSLAPEQVCEGDSWIASGSVLEGAGVL